MFDLILRKATLEGRENFWDLAIAEGVIVDISETIEGEAKAMVECDGRLVTPAFVDLHTHMEKSHLNFNTEEGTLMAAIDAFFKYSEEEYSKEDVIARGTHMIEACIEHGTGYLRTHVVVDERRGTEYIEAISEIKSAYKDYIDIQIVAMMGELSLTQVQRKNLNSALNYDIIGIGGAPTLCENPKETVDYLLQLAVDHNLLLDLHVDESDAPNVEVLEYVIEQVEAYDYGSRTTVGHITALSSVSEKESQKIIKDLKTSGIHVVTLPSCNLFLMGREDQGIVRRGTTRIREMLDAGVNISLASDNIRDPFRPFGNGNLLEEALLTVQVIQRADDASLHKIFQMITENPSKAFGLKNYGIKIGGKGNLLVLDCQSTKEAILSQKPVFCHVHNGQRLFQKEIKTTYFGGYYNEKN